MECPFCKEEIKDDAIKCKHCKSMLVFTTQNPSNQKRVSIKHIMHFNKIFDWILGASRKKLIILGILVLILFVSLPLIHRNGNLQDNTENALKITDDTAVKNVLETTDGTFVAGIEPGQSTASQVEKSFGTPDLVKHHNKYSSEMVYSKKGLSFYYLISDPNRSIFSITVRPPYRLQTTTGILLNESTMANVLKAYGHLDWRTSTDSNYWRSKHNRIEYVILRDTTVPQYPLNEQLHLANRIIEINITSR